MTVNKKIQLKRSVSHLSQAQVKKVKALQLLIRNLSYLRSKVKILIILLMFCFVCFVCLGLRLGTGDTRYPLADRKGIYMYILFKSK